MPCLLKRYQTKQKNEVKIKELKENDLDNLIGEYIPDKVQLVWKDISELNELSKFLKKGNSIYMENFIDHYEYCKYLLKSDKGLEKKYLPDTFEDKYVEKLMENDGEKNEGKKPSIDLVNLIIEEVISPAI